MIRKWSSSRVERDINVESPDSKLISVLGTSSTVKEGHIELQADYEECVRLLLDETSSPSEDDSRAGQEHGWS